MSSVASKYPDYAGYPTLTRESARASANSLLGMRGTGLAVGSERLLEIERFYRSEARMLDEERYQEWYDLLADDLFYWMPLIENRFRRDQRPLLDPEAMAYFDERKVDIAVRIGRIASNLVWTEDPPTRHVYVIGNVEAFATDSANEFEVHSTFIQYRNRGEHDEATLIGRRRDLLRSHEGTYLVAKRLILLPQSTLLTKNLTVFF